MKLPDTTNWGDPQREWPAELPDPNAELVDLLEDALIDFGPDGHCDGAAAIAAIMTDWFNRKRS